ncbi:tRNA (adenosine(37)-N6)-threonylcarbamoyltransferase complex dimerization subunit type 1 TsaB [uncultured Pseudodesulfovibrio sp.]|uniref:tRNA (adenosine(37)-N6)-threonylcarbamoyltransferase complex dimerization subunit type 1 TsaB n=1 Tax=uncultured Pseudodesulfovibrio sp. TaxID=2035858 RepID=UPI0029C978BF|nr:tRNA (adenosine(37)-N6)-threonylcarbamoyltransferase complex dimerization subunit type 1 TsaB [uncultured Pseudodesulfovibrio sp.]
MPKTIQPHDLTLVLSGPEERLQLVLGQPGPDGLTLLASRQWTVPGQSVRFLVPGLKSVLDEFGLDTSVLQRIACVRGPGSFTGLRLVLAAAEGVAAGLDLSLAGLDYLPLLATGPGPLLSGTLHVLTYARRGLVYMQSFNCPDLTEIAPLDALTLEQARQRMADLGTEAHLMGTGLRKNPDFFAELAKTNPGYIQLDAAFDNPAPELLLAAAEQAAFGKDSIEPIYVRPSDAEANLDQIAAKRGLDPEEARMKLEALSRA